MLFFFIITKLDEAPKVSLLQVQLRVDFLLEQSKKMGSTVFAV